MLQNQLTRRNQNIEGIASHPFPTNRLGSKTPAPKKLINNSVTSKKVLCRTTGLNSRTFHVYPDENPSSSGRIRTTESIEPQRLFKDVIKTPGPSRANFKYLQNPLTDKTNTVKKPRVNRSGVEGTNDSPSQKLIKPITTTDSNLQSTLMMERSTPQSHRILDEATQLGSPDLSSSSPKMLYRTPVTSQRARRPPAPVELSPEFYEDDLADSSYISLQLDLNPDHIPDVEYGPPTAYREKVEITEPMDWSDFGNLLRAPGSFLGTSHVTHRISVDSSDEIISEDGDKSQWLHEPVHPFPSYDLDLDDSFDHLISTSHTRAPPTRPMSTTQPKARSMTNLSSRSRPTVSSSKNAPVTKARAVVCPTRPTTTVKRSSKLIRKPTPPPPAWVSEYNQTIKELRDQESENLLIEINTFLDGSSGLSMGDGMKELKSFVDGFRFSV